VCDNYQHTGRSVLSAAANAVFTCTHLKIDNGDWRNENKKEN